MQKFNLIHLQADENKFLTDGKIFVKSLDIGQGQSEEDWTEVDKTVVNLQRIKQRKTAQNDMARDKALYGGVTYSNILFDSDTDQKTNLIGTILSMSDTDTITWFGMDNTALLCTKDDLYAISDLIKELHSFCWENNAYIKEQITNAETIEELEQIEINYDRTDT